LQRLSQNALAAATVANACADRELLGHRADAGAID